MYEAIFTIVIINISGYQHLCHSQDHKISINGAR